MKFSWITATTLALAFQGLSAGDLPTVIQAKFIRILASSAGSAGKVNCSNPALLDELGKVGVISDPGSKIAWASAESAVKSLKAAGKLVICPKVEWLSVGGAIAVVEEDGKPQVYLHMGHISASGIVLSDSVLKIGKRL
jgi:hypothetical protein